MSSWPDLGIWDLVLLLVVTTQTTVVAYVRQARWKAFVLLFPFPFTAATLAVGKEVGVAAVGGFSLLLVFGYGLRWLHHHLRLPIIPAIIIPAALYCVLGAVLVDRLPRSSAAFWSFIALLCTVAGVLFWQTKQEIEQGHRTPLPLWKKLPIVALVVMLLIVLKSVMQGFITAFPMVGITSAYENRYSLRTFSRHMPMIVLTVTPIIVMSRLTHRVFGLAWSLGVGWIGFFLVLGPVTCYAWRHYRGNVRRSPLSDEMVHQADAPFQK